MGKIYLCATVNPSLKCRHIVRGATVAAVLKLAAEHAKTHGIEEVTPKMMAKMKAAIADEPGLEKKPLDKPDEVREFKDGKGKMEVVRIGGLIIGRGTFEPGWRWSAHVKPIVKTASCGVNHTGYIIEGRIAVRMDDGSEMEFGPGDSFVMPPGHDAWTVGDRRCVMLDVTGIATYAKPR